MPRKSDDRSEDERDGYQDCAEPGRHRRLEHQDRRALHGPHVSRTSPSTFFDLAIRQGGHAHRRPHTVEDLGIAFGRRSRGARRQQGIRRYGESTVPMDETLAQVGDGPLGQAYLVYNMDLPKKYKLKDFDPGLAEDVFRSVVNHAHEPPRQRSSRPRRHTCSRRLQGLRPRLDQATSLDPRIRGVLSTKGRI